MPTWDERNAQKRLQEERAKLRVPPGTSVQRNTLDTLPQSTSLSDHKPSDPLPETAVGDPLALVSNGSPVGSPLESAPKTAKKRSRQLLKIRLEHADNVMNIVENWRLERQAAPKIAKAIQLLAAIEAGNTDYIRENYPLLVEALQKSQKRKVTPSLKESESLIERESAQSEVDPAIEQIAAALQTITGRDRHLNRDVYELALDLNAAEYTADDIEAWYQRCWPHDWRAVKAAQERRVEQPSLKIIRECIGQVRSLPVDAPEPVDDWNPYAPAVDDPVEAWPPQACTVPERIRAWWSAAKDQLSVQLNRATFETWVKPTDPIHFVGDPRAGGTLYVAVPHHYGKEWIDKHLLTALNKTFDELLNYDGQTRRRISEELLFDVQIIVEGDPVPGLDR